MAALKPRSQAAEAGKDTQSSALGCVHLHVSLAPDPSTGEVGQTGAPEVAEPEQHECNGVAHLQDERIEYPWEAHRSEQYRGGPQGESHEKNVQHSCRLFAADFVPDSVTQRGDGRYWALSKNGGDPPRRTP